MTTKLNLIKSALRESIEMASKARLNRVNVGPFFTVQQKADAAFDMNAQKMTPLACKALLTAIEGFEILASTTSGEAYSTLSSITSEWPDV